MIRLQDEEKIQDEEEEEEEEYPQYQSNIPESGKKFVEEQDAMRLNINTQEDQPKNFIQGLAHKYLAMKNQFMPALTKNTVNIGTFRVGTVDPVFNRLNTDAKYKKLDKDKEREKTKKVKNDIPVKMKPDYVPLNTGERLYQRSRINKEKMSRLAQKELKKKEKEEENKLNGYKPQINEFTHKYYKRSYKVPISDCLKEVHNKILENLQKKKEESEKKIEEDHPFVPQLNKVSLDMTSRKVKRELSIHEQLAQQSPKKCDKYQKRVEKEAECNESSLKK